MWLPHANTFYKHFASLFAESDRERKMRLQQASTFWKHFASLLGSRETEIDRWIGGTYSASKPFRCKHFAPLLAFCLRNSPLGLRQML